MKRRQFITTNLKLGMALIAIPHMAFKMSSIPDKELIGKGKPDLFGEDYNLRYEAHLAFKNMRAAALNDGIQIQVVSSYRSFKHQKTIWEKKYLRFINNGLTPQESINSIIKYSTIPGTSRHHWGTEIDIIGMHDKRLKNVLQPRHFENNGIYHQLKKWLDTNANTFGFYLVYTNDAKRKGFKYEPWHYSYKPLSSGFLTSYKTLDLNKILQNEKLLGSNHFTDVFIKTYMNENILDINPELL